MSLGFVPFSMPPSCSRKVVTGKNAWRSAGLGDDVNGYSLHHTMARELRRRAVPAEQIELMFGHRRPDKTSQINASYEAVSASLCVYPGRVAAVAVA
jgi:hypothetical protein